MSANGSSKPSAWAKRQAAAAGLAATLVALAVYTSTLAPSIFDGDNPELVTAVHTLGVPHPTGYPLLVLLAKALESLIPIGTVAYRLNLVSAIFGAAAAGVVGWTAARLTGHFLWGVAAGLLAAFGRGLWGQSVAFEVYSLHALLVALVMAAIVYWHERRTARRGLLLALAVGFALVHHRTAVFFALPAWLYCTIADRARGWRWLLGMVTAAVAPLLLYLVLFPLSWRHPVMDWGAVHLGWQNWLQHVSGGQYGWRAFGRSLPAAVRLAGTHWHTLAGALTWAGVGLAALGAVFLSCHPLLPVTVAGFLGTLLWAYSYDVGDALVFAVPAEMVLALWCVLGLALLARWAQRLPARASRWALPAAGVAAALLVAGMLHANWAACDQTGAWYTYRDAMMLLAPRPPNSVLVVDGDTQFGSVCYLQEVEGFRRDVLATSSVRCQDPNYIVSLKHPLLREAAAQAYRSLEDPTALRPFQKQLIRELVPRLGGRRLFATFEVPGRAPEFAWKDEGMFQEVLSRWPEMTVPVPAAAKAEGRLGFLGAEVVPRQAKPGDFIRVRLWWRPSKPITQPVQLKVKFIGLAKSRDGSHFGFGRHLPLCHGRLPLPTAKPGTAYLQSGWDMVPMNAPPGPYVLQILVVEGGREQWLVPQALTVR